MADKIATREAYGKALAEIAQNDDRIYVFDADLSGATKTGIFKKAFPERHFNAGIAEVNMVGMAAGFAASGKIPFASTFAVFGTGRAYDVVRNNVCYPNLNVKLACTHAGITVGEDGATHQSLEDIALMNELPNMTVMCPADGVETKKVLQAAIEHKGPVYIRLGRAACPIIYDENYKFEIGKADTLRDGDDVTIIAYGMMVYKSLEAAEELAKEGINARVINMATIKPLDKEAVIKAVKETGAVVTCEEHSKYGGLGSVVAETLATECPAPLEIVAVNDSFGESGKPEELLSKYHLQPVDIVAACKKVIARK